MNTVHADTYRENRARLPLDEIRKLDCQWVAFSADGQQVVASAATIAELAQQVRAAHADLSDVVLERIEVESTDTYLGAAEML